MKTYENKNPVMHHFNLDLTDNVSDYDESRESTKRIMEK